jgi:short-subunit dehydrogenase
VNYTLITGASSGIGEEFARQYAARGNSLILIARSEDKLQALANELMAKHKVNVKVMPVDLAQMDAAEKVYAQCKAENLKVSVLINDAGVGLIGKFDDFEIQRIESMLVLNVVTLTKLTYLFLPDLKKTQGILINIASQVAFTANPYMSSYAATKAYVLSFTEGIRVEYEKEGVRILPVCPGPTYTKFFEKTEASPDDINFKFRPPKDVVEETLAGIENNKDVVLVGWENKIMTTLMRLIPRSWSAKFSSNIVNDEKKRKTSKR